MDHKIVENKDRKRFEMLVEDQTVFVEYIRATGAVYLTHTEVPPSLEGKGIGSTIIKAVLELLKREEALIAPLCPFVAAYIRRHPEWKTILAPKYHV